MTGRKLSQTEGRKIEDELTDTGNRITTMAARTITSVGVSKRKLDRAFNRAIGAVRDLRLSISECTERRRR